MTLRIFIHKWAKNVKGYYMIEQKTGFVTTANYWRVDGGLKVATLEVFDLC